LGRVYLVGLGNPGAGYLLTRHNLGFMLADTVTGGKGFRAAPSSTYIYSEHPDFTAVKPMTYMNRSGRAVRKLMEDKQAEIEDLLIACDDFNLPLGKIRLRLSGSAGGHNGISSVIEHLGSREFARLRMGVGGADEPDKTAYVLGKFKKAELEKVGDMLIDCRNLLECYINNGPREAMNRYNS